MLESPFYYTEEAKRQRSYWRRVAAVALAGLGIAAALIIAFYPRQARADPIAQTTAGAVTVLLHNEPCALKEITNLPNRATWLEGGAVVEGCFGVRQDTGVVIAYFTDKTVVAIPLQAFARVHSS